MSWGGASIQSMSDRSNDYRVALRYIVKGLLYIRLRRILSYLRVTYLLVQLLELDDDDLDDEEAPSILCTTIKRMIREVISDSPRDSSSLSRRLYDKNEESQGEITSLLESFYEMRYYDPSCHGCQ